MRRATIDDVVIDVVEDEDVTDGAEVTNYAIETGEQMADHHAITPSTITITGIFGAKGSDKNLKTLKQYIRESRLVTYTGRNIYRNMVILDIQRNHTVDNKYGFAYSISMQQVDIQGAKRVQIKVLNPSTKKQDSKTSTRTKRVTNKGRQQTKRR